MTQALFPFAIFLSFPFITDVLVVLDRQAASLQPELKKAIPKFIFSYFTQQDKNKE